MGDLLQNKKVHIIILILFVLSIGSVIYLFINHKTIAYVDNSVVLDRFIGTDSVKEEMQTRAGEYQAELNKLRMEIDQLRSTFINESAAMTVAQQTNLKNEIGKKEQSYNDYAKYYSSQLAEVENEKMAPVIAEVNKKIKEFGDKNGYDIIFGATAGGNIIYAKQGINITGKVIDFLNKMDEMKKIETKEEPTIQPELIEGKTE